MSTPEKTYRAIVSWEDGWWMIRIPELDLITQAETEAEIPTMARGVIEAHLDCDPDLFSVDIETPADTR